MNEGTAGELAVMPERIGRYRLVRPLSKGGMALVYEARKEALGGIAPRVAIKVILPDYAASSTFRELFINEARLGAAMQHQNLVQILDFDSDGDRYFIVMEYVEGLTLSKMIGIAARHDLKVPMQVICEVGRQACEGLHFAHQAVDGKGRALNMIHRDIKPSNLIVNGEGGVKILDFGISKGRLRHERTGSVKGTWGYMAPEQATGERIGPNVDVFGLGVVLYEMASRRSMFKGRKEEEIRQMLLADHAARAASALDASYAPLAKVLVRALHRDPKQRFVTAADFGRHLADLLPDPITVREELVRFYRAIAEIHEREAPARTRAPSGEAASEPSAARLAPRFLTLDASRAEPQQRTMLLAVLVGALSVVAAFLLGYVLQPLLAGSELPVPQPSVVAADPRRPVPVPPAAVPPVETTPRVVQAALPAEPGGDVAPGPGEGVLKLDTIQEAEIWLDGQLLLPPYGRPRVVKAGRHVVVMVDRSGRRAAFQVDLAEGGSVTRVYDFERMDWRQ